ncbi:MAG: substrate-binding domain-containing protein [Clostridiales bacterium]|nr:substrate-binding domain-containing protein [Clostridiales bacterium]
MKRSTVLAIICFITLLALTACSGNSTGFSVNHDITVVSREDGSGTRGAFIELFGVEVKTDDGGKQDMTTEEAVIADKTAIMMTNIAGDPYAIGYISLGSLNDTVKALQIDGVTATAANIKNGSYVIQRPFNIAVKGEAVGLAKDFIDFILSAEGQAVIGKDYVAIDENAPAYAGNKPSGRIVVGGSSSVTPVMEKLKEAYAAINSGAEIEIQESDSSAGMTNTMNGTFDIGMASRALKDSELAELTEISIALDGIAVIVNTDNPLNGISVEQVKDVYTGGISKWSSL